MFFEALCALCILTLLAAIAATCLLPAAALIDAFHTDKPEVKNLAILTLTILLAGALLALVTDMNVSALVKMALSDWSDMLQEIVAWL